MLNVIRPVSPEMLCGFSIAESSILRKECIGKDEHYASGKEQINRKITH